MTYNYKNIFHIIHHWALRSCLLFVISFFYTGGAMASDELRMAFLKENSSVGPNQTFFNTLRVWTDGNKSIDAELSFTGPETWKIISFSNNKFTVVPGDTVYLPIRISPDSKAVGNVTYIVSANIRTKTRQYQLATYFAVPPIVNWDFNVESTNLIITDNFPNASVRVRLSNKGNTNELIKLDYRLGKMLFNPDNQIMGDVSKYIELPAFTDTVIVTNVSYHTKLSASERFRYENNWRESTVRVAASTDRTKRSSELLVKKLNSTYTNERQQQNTPLNFEYSIYNIMSNYAPRHSLNIYGTLQFEKDRELTYYTGMQNFRFDGLSTDFDFNRQLMYNVRYIDKRSVVQLGYNVFSGNLHSISGRGIVGAYRLGQNHRFNYSLIQNPYTQNLGLNFGYQTGFKRLSVMTELTHEAHPDKDYQASSALLGLGLSFLKNHNVNLQLMGSNVYYKLGALGDTTLQGMSYRMNYSFNSKPFNLRFSAMNSYGNYIQNAGMSQYMLNAALALTDVVRFNLFANQQSYAANRYPHSFGQPLNINATDYARLTANIQSGIVTYQFGPSYSGSMRQMNNDGFASTYKTVQPGLWLATSVKLDGISTISPNFSVNNMRVSYMSSNPNIAPLNVNNGMYYSLGVNYYDQNWRINAYYTTGSTADLYRNILVTQKPTMNRSVQLRPSYENYFFNRTMRLTASVNMAYYMPSERENTTYNVKVDQTLKNGWSGYLSAFMFSNSRKDPDYGRVKTVDFNFVAGVRKSFNLQQPRRKYYDFEAVFFNDLDGDRVKSDNEPPVSNVIVNVSKERKAKSSRSTIAEMQLVTDAHGRIKIYNLPKDTFMLGFQPMVNLQSYFFLHGSEQSYVNDKSRIVYIPLVESYKIIGRIVMKRDPNSREGKIDLDGVRITAVNPKGETFSVLSEKDGSFLLSVPNADTFTVRMTNVFGQHFDVENDEVVVQFVSSKTVNIDFSVVERRRGINFNGGGFFSSGD